MSPPITFRTFPLVAGQTKTTFVDLPWSAQSIQVVNETNNRVRIHFGRLAQNSDMDLLYDMVIPPWCAETELCNADTISVELTGFQRVAQGSTVLVRVADHERQPAFYQLPQGGIQRPVEATMDAGQFYSAIETTIAGGGTYQFGAAGNVKPPNQITSVDIANFSTLALQLILSGTGSLADAAQTSGYVAIANKVLKVPGNFLRSTDCQLDSPGGDVFVVNTGPTPADVEIAVWGY